MAGLDFEDLMLLNEAKGNVLDMASVADEASLHRLVSLGLADDQGILTAKGAEAVVMVREKFEKLYTGVPLDQRVRNEAKEAERADSSPCGWSFGEYKKKQYVTNAEILLIGKPVPLMRASAGSSSLRKSISDTITSQSAGRPSEFVELFPFAYHFDRGTSTQLIWLKSKDGKVVRAIQAKYFDFIKARFPSSTFHLNVKRQEKYVPLQIRVVNRGFKNNTVGLLMICNTEGMTVPTLEGGEA